MPILGIGKTKVKSELGYTLIEILAVLIILGLIGLLAFPRFFGAEEKAYLNLVGKLVRTDLNTAREEAFAGQTEITVAFFENGYSFNIGETEIRRVFDKHQFQWGSLVGAGESVEPLETMVEVGGVTDNEGEPDPGITELCFNRDKDLPETTINWTTGHFQGIFVLKPDGSASWDYASKK